MMALNAFYTAGVPTANPSSGSTPHRGLPAVITLVGLADQRQYLTQFRGRPNEDMP
jgi:hypothetical protein